MSMPSRYENEISGSAMMTSMTEVHGHFDAVPTAVTGFNGQNVQYPGVVGAVRLGSRAAHRD